MGQEKQMDANPGYARPIHIAHWGNLRAVLIDAIISLKTVFHSLAPDLLFFWDLPLSQGGEGTLRTCCHSVGAGMENTVLPGSEA